MENQMITLFRKTEDDEADRIEDALNELVLAYKTEIAEDEPTPTIRDGDNVIREQKEISEWLMELTKELQFQRSLTGDACYIDPETGETC
ncbi:MAG: hypothetical protein LAT80_14100 [Balneolaceae bacterium]|nr:hypothetical protein [Balneolaceae bacterium]